MINLGSRQQGNPVIITENEIQQLKRLPLTEKALSESWLQDVIHKRPEILPVDEIESIYSPLIPIGKEVATSAGSIDNLYINPDGYLTLVETKLWRNPEARREVVGQIIDYAKDLSKWTYKDLDQSVQEYNAKYFNERSDLVKTVKKYIGTSEFEESQFIDQVSRNLKRGRILLLVVGDGIRESVEEMIDYVSQYPQFLYTLALVELQIYKKDHSYIIIPNIITRTKEITRAVFKLDYTDKQGITLNVQTDLQEETHKSQSGKRYTLSEEEFFDILRSNVDKDDFAFAHQIIQDASDEGWEIEWKQGSYAIKYVEPVAGNKITLFIVEKDGSIFGGHGGLINDELRKLKANLVVNVVKLYSIKQSKKWEHQWERMLDLKLFKTEYTSFIELLKQFIQEVDKFQKS